MIISHLADVLVDELMLLDRFLDEAAPPMNSRRAKPQTLRKQQQSSASVTVLNPTRILGPCGHEFGSRRCSNGVFLAVKHTQSQSAASDGTALERVPQPLPGAGTLRTADEDIFE